MKRLIDKSDLIAEIEKRMQELRPTNTQKMQVGEKMDRDVLMWLNALTWVKKVIDTLETKDVDFERELGKYVSDGIHRFFPGVEDDYCTMDSVVWQDYVIETAEHFYELGLKAQKGE